MTDTELIALLAKVDALESEEDRGYTWWDADPDVAWNEPESRHGRLAALYLEAGWEPCYHGDGKFHYNVKLNGMEPWHVFRNKVDAARSDENAYSRIAEVADAITEWELEAWWENLPEDDISHIPGAIPFNGTFKVWQCGRSGGYLNAPDVEEDPRIMLQLAYIAQGARDYYNSADWGEYLAEMALERDTEEQLARLASPRADRVEA
jgi:hypothetical protein